MSVAKSEIAGGHADLQVQPRVLENILAGSGSLAPRMHTRSPHLKHPSGRRVSVLINNYNNAAFLRHCLESVLTQSVRPDEIIVYDDGSTDESREVLAEYSHAIHLIAAPHGRGTPQQNQASAIYAAFQKSTGDVIFLLDGDDAFLPGKVNVYLDAFQRTPGAVMVQAPLEKIDETGKMVGVEFEAARHQQNYLDHINSENELNIYYPTSSLAFSRVYLAQQLPLNFGDGFMLWPDARLALVAPHFGPVVALPQPYSQWRRHPRSHTVAKPLTIYELVRLNQRYFNAFSKATGRQPIVPWRSRYHRRRMLRHYLVPDALIHWFRAIRWATLSPAKRQQLIRGPSHDQMMSDLKREREKLLNSSVKD